MKTQPDVIIAQAFRFIHNIPMDIVDQAFPIEEFGWLNRHLNEKYQNYCRREGYASPKAVLNFFASLDAENTRVFCRTIAKITNRNLL